jgi:hypothetical protein
LKQQVYGAQRPGSGKGWLAADRDSNPREETTIRKRETQITTTTAQTVFYYYQSSHLFPCQ